MASVSFRQVWKKYGDVAAVKDLNVECKDGTFLSILGPSGCGKSSTMRMVAGLEHITAGDILFDNQRINELAPKDRDVAMVFENYALYPHKSVFENMANPLKLRGQDAAKIKERVTSAAKLLEIAHLDAKLRAHMRGEIKHMQKTLGTTMIYVTHDQLEAMTMADLIAVMHEGELQQLGSPREVYNKPVNAWVAGFVGEPAMNFVDCAVEASGGKTYFTHPNFKISVTPAQARVLAGTGKAQTIRMGVRPDALSISLARPKDEHMTGKIFVTELLGGDMVVDVDLDDARIRVKTSTEFEGEQGETCYISVNREKWHAFSKETGRALLN